MLKRCLPYAVIIILALCALVLINTRYNTDINLAQENFINEQHLKTRAVAASVEGVFKGVYENLRTISRLPSVKNIDRHGTNLSADDNSVIQEIYNNAANNINLSEVYILPADFNPEQIDPITQKLEEPIKVFDHLIVGKTGEALTQEVGISRGDIEEVEIHEYRLMKEQLDFFSNNFSNEGLFKGLAVPAVTGHDVITCDNRFFNMKRPNDADRTGLVYMVPFYRPNGQLAGGITGVILNSVLQDFLPSGNHVLLNKNTDNLIYSIRDGESKASSAWVKKAQPNPGLIYSEVYKLNINDAAGAWYLWAGAANEEFWNLRQVGSIKDFARLGYQSACALALLLMLAVFLMQSRRQKLEIKNAQLDATMKQLKSVNDKLVESEHIAQASLKSVIASEKKIKSIIETSNDAFVSMDETGAIVDWNMSAERIFGWSRAECIGRQMAEMIIPESFRQKHNEGLKHYCQTGEGPVLGKTLELSAMRKDGQQIPVEITIWSIKIDDKHLFNAFIRDINERKKLEIELKRSNQELIGREKEAQQALRYIEKALEDRKQTQLQLLQSEKMASVGQLAAGIAHEINNPVGFISNNMEMLEQYMKDYTAIINMVGMLKESVDNNDLQKAKESISAIRKFEEEINLEFVIDDITKILHHNQKGIERIKKIVMDLRTFAREDMGVMDLVQIEDVIDNILGIVHNEIKYKASLKKEYSKTPLIKCNSQRIGQVFINILINATHAIDDKGTITIKTYVDEKYVNVEITDTGRGIDEKNLNKIFDAFFTTKPVGQGTGLGLSISHEIIKKHNGEIKVRSEVGKGTTFTIQLPLNSDKG